jgi:undecaprenyl-diphosphatase
LVEGVCFLFTAALLLVGSWRAKKVKARPQIGAKSALAVGVAQAFAAGFPGISRSGSTISTGMICGVSKEYMVRYSFILGIPAILAANVMEIKDAVALGEQIDILPVIIGVVTAAVVGFAAIKALEWLVKIDKFKIFGYYCLVLGVVVIIAGIVEKVR